MGKGLRNRDSGFTRESPLPGCMFGILHHLNQHQPRWNQVRKRLPHIRQHSGKHVPAGDLESNASATDSAKVPEKVEAKADDSPNVVKKPGVQPKSSVKSRLKSLITKELSRRKVRHRRSVSCPSPEIPLNDENVLHPQNEYSSVASLLDPPLPKKKKDAAVITNDSYEIRAAMLDTNHPKQCDNSKQPIRRTQSLYSRERAKNGSVEESRIFLNALDLLNMRQEVFLKILRDPNSSLAHSLHGTQASKGLTKSVSFPSRLATSADTCSKDDITKTAPKRLEPSSPGSKNSNRRESKLVLERFKNLKEKIRLVIKESRKEKRRIVMDAVLHKVPHDRNVQESTSVTSHHSSPFGKSQASAFKRTSSLNESVDRYNRLLEPCYSRDEKHHTSEKSSLRASSPGSSAVALDRILSMPNLRNYPSFRIEDSPEASYSETLRTAASSNNSLDIPLGSEKQTREDSSLDSKIPENSLDVSEFSDDVSENYFTVECNVEVPSSLNSKSDKPIPTPLPDSIFQETAAAPADLSVTEGIVENGFSTDEEGISADEQKRSLLQIQVDERNKAEFNYVKDVLELSGYGGNEFLEKWLATNSPMNLSAFDDVDESCYDQLLLFDLINEVLLQIYERTSLYWPKPLTCRSNIHPMPVGYHLLEEVWDDVSWCLGFKVQNDQLLLDDALSHDLTKPDGWMNLQFDAECVGLELEDLILDDLLEELI